MKKRFVTVAVVLLSLLALMGCAKKEAAPAAASGGDQAVAIGTKDSPVKVTYIKKDVDPITDKEVTEKVIQLIEAGMAKEGEYVDLEILSAPAGRYQDVVPMAYRTGQLNPDIIYFQGGDLPIAQEGLLTDLTPYVEKSKWVKAAMEEHNKMAMANYPYLLWLAPPRIQIPVIRQDHYEKFASAKKVTQDPTIDNYYALFKDLKTVVKWPITTDGTIAKLDSVFNHAFGVTATIMKKGDKYVYYQVTDENKKKIEWYAKLYKEGLLDNEYVTKAWDTMEQAFYEGTAGWVSGSAGAVIDVYDNKMYQSQGVHLVCLPPAKGVSQAFQSLDVSKEPRGFGINAASKVKDAAWAVLEFMASPQGRIIDKLGIEGMHYNVKDGRYVLTDQFPSWWGRFHEGFNNLDVSKVDGDLMTKAGEVSLQEANQYFHPDTNVLLPEDLLPLKDAMDKLYTEYSTDIIRGVRPIGAYDEFVTKWNAAGGDKISDYLKTVLK